MAENGSCNVCNCPYNDAKIQHVQLGCSHSFCLKCLHQLHTHGDNNCPDCKVNWLDSSHNTITTLISVGPQQKHAPENVCDEQHTNYVLWCNSCSLLFCTKCVETHTKCDWSTAAEKLNALKREYVVYYRKAQEKMKNVDNQFNEASSSSHSSSLQQIAQSIMTPEQHAHDIVIKIGLWQVKYSHEFIDLISKYQAAEKKANVIELNGIVKDLHKLTKKELPERKNELLMQISAAYEKTSENDVELFIRNLQQSLATDGVQLTGAISRPEQGTEKLEHDKLLSEKQSLEASLEDIRGKLHECEAGRDELKEKIERLNARQNFMMTELKETLCGTEDRLTRVTDSKNRSVQALGSLLSPACNRYPMTDSAEHLLSAVTKAVGNNLGLWADIFQDEPRCIVSIKSFMVNAFWRVTNEREAGTALQLLNHAKPECIHVELPKSETFGDEIISMLKFMKTMDYAGRLRLDLLRSYDNYDPCDEIFVPLDEAKCTLYKFRGCVSSAAAVQTLYSGPSRHAECSVPDALKHNFHQCGDDFPGYLSVKVRHRQCYMPPQYRPLPGGSWLIVDGIPVDGLDDAVSLIQAIAPHDNRFGLVQLRQCQLNDADLDQLHILLLTEGILTTFATDTNGWQVVRMQREVCSLCMEQPRNNERCVTLKLNASLL